MEEPLTVTARRLLVSYRRRTSGGRSMMRRSITGTATSTWHRSRSTSASAPAGSKLRAVTTVLLYSVVSSVLSQPQLWNMGAAIRCVSRARYGSPVASAMTELASPPVRAVCFGWPVVPDVRMTWRLRRPGRPDPPRHHGGPPPAASRSMLRPSAPVTGMARTPAGIRSANSASCTIAATSRLASSAIWAAENPVLRYRMSSPHREAATMTW